MIILSSTPESIASLDGYLLSILKKHGLSQEHFPEMLISLTEAVNNAIFHGNALDVNKFVKIQHHFDGSVMSFYIADEGTGFDQKILPDPTKSQNIGKSGGRGVFIMRTLCHDLKYHDMGKKLQLCFMVKQATRVQNS